MSYCVNCGVELESGQKHCPLCGVKVVNPAQKEPPQEEKTFPQQKDELQKKDRLFWLKFISIIFAALILTCVLTNLLYDGHLSWSIYVIGGAFMLWVFSTSPLYFRSFDLKKMLAADMAAIFIGLSLIEYQAPGSGWVLFVALPLILYCILVWLLIIYLAKIKLITGLGISAVLLISIALMMPLLETLLDLYFKHSVVLFWSWFITAPCLTVSALLILLNRNKAFKEEMSRRLHF